MYCENCGTKRNNSHKFCTNCGKKFPSKKKIKTNNNATLIIGFISWCFIALPIISIPIAIASLIIGIKNKKPIIQLLPAIICIILSILVTISIISIGNLFFNKIETKLNNEFFNDKYYYEYNPKKEEYDISAYHWLGDDNSLLALNNRNNNYIWYANELKKEDNYYQGNYEIYNGNDAIFYIANNLKEYGLTEYHQQQNIISSNHYINEYYLIIISCEKMIINGTEQTPTNNIVYYYGYYETENNYLDLIDIDNRNKVGFTRKEAIDTIGINKKSQI